MSEERRQDYPLITDWLKRLDAKQEQLNIAHAELRMYQEKELNELKIAQKELKVLQEKDLDVAEDWRKIFCGKIDRLAEVVGQLPCDKRESRWLSQTVQLKYIWGVLTFFVTLEGIFIVALINHIGK